MQRYVVRIERISVFHNYFTCAYHPCYGLVLIYKTTQKIKGNSGFFFANEGDVITVKYIVERAVLPEHEHLLSEKLDEEGIFEILNKDF